MQKQILERNPDADLAVYVVWLPVLPQDSRFSVTQALVDPRVTHFWDNEQILNNELARAFDLGEGLVWDVYFLFGPDAAWGEAPPRALGTGSPVVAHMATLESLLRPYVD